MVLNRVKWGMHWAKRGEGKYIIDETPCADQSRRCRLIAQPARDGTQISWNHLVHRRHVNNDVACMYD